MLIPSSSFGACSNPGITYDPSAYTFTPTDTVSFPFATSSDIHILNTQICQRLRHDECGASIEANTACDYALRMVFGLNGVEAAESWNKALGVTHDESSDEQSLATTAPSIPPEHLGSSSLDSASQPFPASSSHSSYATSDSSQSPPSSSSSSSKKTIVIQARSPQDFDKSAYQGNDGALSDGSPFDTEAEGRSSPTKQPKTAILGISILLLLFTVLH